MPKPSEAPWLVRVIRGNLRVALPLTLEGLRDTTAAELASLAAKEMLKIQLSNPGRADKRIDPFGKVPMAVRLYGKDNALIPSVALEPQLMGHWFQAELPTEEAREVFGRISVCELELVDILTLV